MAVRAVIWLVTATYTGDENGSVRILEKAGFELVKEKGSVRYYSKTGCDRLIRVDYHGSREVPTGTCHAILKAAGLKRKGG